MSTKYDSAMVIVIVLIFIRALLRYSNLYGIDSSTSLVASAFVFFALVSQYNFTWSTLLQGALVREHGTATSQEDSASERGTVASPVHRHETFLRITHNILCRWHRKIKQ